jgi:hypothetical protein
MSVVPQVKQTERFHYGHRRDPAAAVRVHDGALDDGFHAAPFHAAIPEITKSASMKRETKSALFMALAPATFPGTLTRAFASGANFAQSCDCIQIRTADERETRDIDRLVDLVDQDSPLTAEETTYFGCVPPELICHAFFVESR